MAAGNEPQRDLFPISLAVGGNVTRLDYERLKALASTIGLEMAIVRDMPAPTLTVLQDITTRDAFLGYEHFQDYNRATGLLAANIFSRTFDACVDAAPRAARWAYAHTTEWPISQSSIDNFTYIKPREELGVIPRAAARLPSLPFENVVDLAPSQRSHRIHAAICGQYALEAGRFIDAYAVGPLDDHSNNLFLTAMARQVLSQIDQT